MAEPVIVGCAELQAALARLDYGHAETLTRCVHYDAVGVSPSERTIFAAHNYDEMYRALVLEAEAKGLLLDWASSQGCLIETAKMVHHFLSVEVIGRVAEKPVSA